MKTLVPEPLRPLARKTWGKLRSAARKFGMVPAAERRQRDRLIAHAFPRGYPRVVSEFSPELTPEAKDIEIAERVRLAWQCAMRDGGKAPLPDSRDAWHHLSGAYHGDILALLRQGSSRELAHYLCNMSRHGATVGITQGVAEYQTGIASRRYRAWGGVATLDRLVSLAEAAGALHVENPEQGRWGGNLYEEPDRLIERIEHQLGIDISPPEVDGCLLKLRTGRGGFHFRDVTSLYAAWRLRATSATAPPVVCEIGAGTGRVAYYAARFGIHDYTIYDLPTVNVLQGFFILRALPGASVLLYGERGAADGQAIRILPHWVMRESKAGFHDVALNQDSFPEIDRTAVRQYLIDIRRTTKARFLSINQECEAPTGEPGGRQLVVSDVVAEVGGFRLLHRFPCWVRSGYVEELYGVAQ